LTGSGWLPQAVFPDDAELNALKATRNQILQRNNRRVAEALVVSATPTWVTTTHHGCFFVLRPVLDTVVAVEGYLAELSGLLERAGLYARMAPSFGYDFIALSRIGAAEANQSSVRVALPDYCDEDIERVIGIVGSAASEWLPTR
jgi:hypothetical protein